MSPLVTAAVGALTTISTVGAFLLAHAGAIKKEYQMVRADVQAFITAVEQLEAAINARIARPAPVLTPDPDEVAALADATAKANALAAVVSQP